MFEIIPAIDLRGGRCVRLEQGDFDRETVFDDDPTAVAARWVEQGATRLHVVDLDGAASGRPIQLEAIRSIVRRAAVPIELGGGLRSLANVRAAFAAGVEAVIIGTAAVEDPEFLGKCLDAYSDRIIVGVDARNGLVAVRGWQQETTAEAVEFVRRLAALGVQRIVYTDIERDGMLQGPNVEAVSRVVTASPARVTASGGVSTAAHIRALRDAGASGAILGTALYTGQLKLDDALAAADGATSTSRAK